MRISNKLKNLATLLAIAGLFLIAGAAPVSAQTKTTVSDHAFYGPDGNPATGTVKIAAACLFRSTDGYTVAPTQPILVTIAGGNFSAALVPNNTCSNSTNSSYYVASFSLTSTVGSARWTEYWSVPSSGSPVSLATVRIQAPYAPSALIPQSANTFLGGPCSGSPASPSYRTLCNQDLPSTVPLSVQNDTNVTGSIVSQQMILGWTGQLAASRGGTGSAFFGVLGPTALRQYTFPDLNATLEYQARRNAANGYAGLDGSALLPTVLFPATIPVNVTGNAGTATQIQTTGSNNQVWGIAGGIQQWLSAAAGMVWPTGAAGIPNYGGAQNWATSYNASNPIPQTFLQGVSASAPVLFAAPWGSDTANDCLTLVNPCFSIMGAYDKLGVSGGTINVEDLHGSPVHACTLTDPSSCGIWIMTSSDPNYSSPPAGWRKMKGQVVINGLGSGIGAGSFAHGGQTNVSAGSGSLSSKPGLSYQGVGGLWISNIHFSQVCAPALLGYDSNGQDLGANGIWNANFDNVYMATNQLVGCGPTVKIGGESAWLFFNNSQYLGNNTESAQITSVASVSGVVTVTTTGTIPSTWSSGTPKIGIVGVDDSTFNGTFAITVTSSNTFTYALPGPDRTSADGSATSDQYQAFVIGAGASATGNPAFLYMENIFLDFGGVKFYHVAPNPAQTFAYKVLQEGSSSPAFWLSTCSAPAYFTFSNIQVADAASTYAGVRNDCGIASGILVSGTQIDGPATLLGAAGPTPYGPDGFNTPVHPMVMDQRGIFNGNFIGDIQHVRRAFAPFNTRFTNLAVMPSPGTVGAITIASTAGPDGVGNAINVTSSGSGSYALYLHSKAVSVGDIVLCGAWVKSLNPQGFSSTNNLPMNCSFPSTSETSTWAVNRGTLVPNSNGEWAWTWRAFKVASIGASPTNLELFFNVSSTHGIGIYAPVLIQIPAGTVVDNEAIEYAMTMQSFRPDALAGQSSLLPGTEMKADSYEIGTAGSLGALRFRYTVGTGGVTQNTLVQTDSSNPVKVISGTTGAYGVAADSGSAGASVRVSRMGLEYCITDTGGATAGDLVIIGTGTTNYCKDSGQTSRANIPITTRIVGKFVTTAIAGATALVDLDPSSYGTQVPGSFSPGDNLVTNGSKTDYTVLDWSTVQISDEFIGCPTTSTATTFSSGSAAWTLSQISGTGFQTSCAAGFTGWPQYSILQVNTGTTSGFGVQMFPSGGGGSGLVSTGLGNTTILWDGGWVFAPHTTTNISIRVGYMTPNSSTAPPTGGFYVRYDTSVGDTNYMFCTDATATETCNSTGVAPAADTFVRVDITNLATVGKIAFTLYDNAGSVTAAQQTFCSSSCTVTATPPTSSTISQGAQVVTQTNAQSRLYIDAFKMKIRGLSR